MKHAGLTGDILQALALQNSYQSVTYAGNIHLFDGPVPASFNDIPFFDNSQTLGNVGTRLNAIQNNSKGVISYGTEFGKNVYQNDILRLVNTGTDALSFNDILYPRNIPAGVSGRVAPSFGGVLATQTLPTDVLMYSPLYWSYRGDNNDLYLPTEIAAGSHLLAKRIMPRPSLDGSAEFLSYVGGSSYLNANVRFTHIVYNQNIDVDCLVFRVRAPSGQNNGSAGAARTLNLQVYYRNPENTAWVIVGTTMSYSTANNSTYNLVPLAAAVNAKDFMIRCWSTGGLAEGASMSMYLSDFTFGKQATVQTNTFTPTWALALPFAENFEQYVTDEVGTFGGVLKEYPMMLMQVGSGPGQLQLNRTTFTSTEHIVPALAAPFEVKAV